MSANIMTLALRAYMQRKRMENLALRYGRTSPEVLKASKLLDKTILELQRKGGNEDWPSANSF